VAAWLAGYVHRFTQTPSPNYGYDGQRPRWRAVTVHISQGPLEGTLGWLCNPQSQASAHLVVGRAGEIHQLVGLDEAAWCQGGVCKPDLTNPIVAHTVQINRNPNLVSYSVECVGFSRYGQSGALTSVQIDTLGWVLAYLCCRSHLSADRTHILGHYQWDGCTRADCPGFSAGEWEQLIATVANRCLFERGW